MEHIKETKVITAILAVRHTSIYSAITNQQKRKQGLFSFYCMPLCFCVVVVVAVAVGVGCLFVLLGTQVQDK